MVRTFVFAALATTLIAGCSSSSSSGDTAELALGCTTTDGANFINNCSFNVFVEILEGDDDDSGTDFFVPAQSSITLPVDGDFTYGVCKGPERPQQTESGFNCV